jgi:hypothetical protein
MYIHRLYIINIYSEEHILAFGLFSNVIFLVFKYLFFTTKSRPNARIYTIPAEEEEEASHNFACPERFT